MPGIAASVAKKKLQEETRIGGHCTKKRSNSGRRREIRQRPKSAHGVKQTKLGKLEGPALKPTLNGDNDHDNGDGGDEVPDGEN